LTNGWLINGSNLTMASGSTISRSGGNLYTTPHLPEPSIFYIPGVRAITTGKELPTTTSTLNNITTNTGGVHAICLWYNKFAYGCISRFNKLDGRQGKLLRDNIIPVASANAGGTSPEGRIYRTPEFHGNATYSIYRGPCKYDRLYNVKCVIQDGYFRGLYPKCRYFLKLQSSTSTGGPWHDVWSNTYTKTLSAQTILISNYSTDVGGNIYFRFCLRRGLLCIGLLVF